MIRKIPKISIKGAEGACNLLNDAILSICNFEGAGDIQVSDTGAGRKIEKAGDGKRMVQLTNNANPYAGIDVYATPSGGWTPTSGGLTFASVYEDNFQNGLLNQVVEIEPGYRSDWRFNYIRYGAGGEGNVIVPGCPCAFSPAFIKMTSSKPMSNNQIFQSATLHYGPTPSSLLPVVLTASSYLSTSSFFDPILNVNFYYFLTCSLGAYVLTRVYEHSPFGDPFRDSIRYKWVPGFPGNDCGPPFIMNNGLIFSGGDASCVVTLAPGP